MKTAHQLARELLEGPDWVLAINGSCPLDYHVVAAERGCDDRIYIGLSDSRSIEEQKKDEDELHKICEYSWISSDPSYDSMPKIRCPICDKATMVQGGFCPNPRCSCSYKTK